MAILSVADLVDRIGEKIVAKLGPSGWRRSTVAVQVFPKGGQSELHLAFAVGSTRTVFPTELESSRRKRPHGGQVESEILVRWGHRVRGDVQVSDYADALEAEAALVAAILAASRVDVHISVAEMSRVMGGDGIWLVGEVRVVAKHHVQLI